MEVASAALNAATLPDALDELARSSPDQAVVYPGTGITVTARELRGAARRHASGLARAGVRPGEIVGLLAPTGPALPVSLFGITLAGAAVTVLPTGMLGPGSQQVVERLARIVDAAGMSHLVADAEFAELAAGLRRLRPGLTILGQDITGPAQAALPGAEPEALAVVQFTSGSTSRPKGVMLTHRNVMAGLATITATTELGPDDTLVSWVPHFHDMGLFMPLAMLLGGGGLHIFSPSAFVRRPESFLAYFAENGGTLTGCPNFAYDLLAGASAGLPEASLRGWRLAINGAEPVSPATVSRFTAELAPYGVGPAVMSPAYGMAEATLAAAFPAPRETPKLVYVDRDRLADDHEVAIAPAGDPAAKAIVSVGQAAAGMSLRIADGNGGQAGEGRLGEIQLRGAPVTAGYLGDPVATAALFDGDWLRTGDLGFCLDGDLYVTSRMKDMIIVAGRNYFPEDVEMLAAAVPGVHRGRCVAFASHGDGEGDGAEVITVAAERAPRSDPAELAARIRREVAAGLGLAALSVHIVGPGHLPRTTSGKKQRALTRARLGLQSPEPASRDARAGSEEAIWKGTSMTIPSQVSRGDILAAVRDNLGQELGPGAAVFDEATPIAELPGADSAKQLRVIARTEKHFGITVGDENTPPAETVGGFVDQVGSALGSRFAG